MAFLDTGRLCLFNLYVQILVAALLSSTFFTSIGEGRKTPSPCIPASCGPLHNITYPFRLHNQIGPKHCSYQDPNYELSCENNRTIFHLGSVSYYVDRISYDRCSLRLVDTRLDPNNSCSFPTGPDIFKYYESDPLPFQFYFDWWVGPFNVITLLECSLPLNSSMYHDDVSHCFNASSSSSSSSSSKRKEFYLIYNPSIQRLTTSCAVKHEFLAPPASGDNDTTHSLLMAGFDLNWNCDFQCQSHPSRFHRYMYICKLIMFHSSS